MDPVKAASGQKSIEITLSLSQWDDTGPEFRDNMGDTNFRNEPYYDLNYRYINNTCRNDFDYTKVSQDKDNLYIPPQK